MKKLLLLTISFLISIHSFNINAQESKSAGYIKGSAKIIGGAFLTLCGLSTINLYRQTTKSETDANNDWDAYLDSIKKKFSTKHYNLIEQRGQQQHLEDLDLTKKSCFIVVPLFSIPGIALIISGVKKIHDTRTAE